MDQELNILSNIWTYSTAVMQSASQLHAVAPHYGNTVISGLYKNCFHLIAGQQLNVSFHTPRFHCDNGYPGLVFQYANLISYFEVT
jgi:hypothetical protein